MTPIDVEKMASEEPISHAEEERSPTTPTNEERSPEMPTNEERTSKKTQERRILERTSRTNAICHPHDARSDHQPGIRKPRDIFPETTMISEEY